ncbi:MAG TPA: hypothetical protein VKC60_15365 [Opitutaceae bacterium]|nr:hypothetical protein [Opitutaceae bacterium]
MKIATSRVLSAAALALLAGCATATRVTTKEDRYAQANPLHMDFVRSRTEELYRTGAFKSKTAAEQKAIEQANALFGPQPAMYSSTAQIGESARRANAQDKVNEGLAKMARDQSRF